MVQTVKDAIKVVARATRRGLTSSDETTPGDDIEPNQRQDERFSQAAKATVRQTLGRLAVRLRGQHKSHQVRRPGIPDFRAPGEDGEGVFEEPLRGVEI